MPSKLLGYIYLTLAMITVGSTVVTSKIASTLPPFTATALRFAIALPCFLLLMRMTATALPRLARRDWALLFLQACAGGIGYTALLMAGLRASSATDAGVILGTLPLAGSLFAVCALGEWPPRSLLAAIAVAAAGVAAATYAPGGAPGSGYGNLLILAAVMCESVFILLNKRIGVEIPPLALATVMTGIGLAASGAVALFESPWDAAIGREALWAVAYYALIPTVCGFSLWYAGAARVSGAEASLFTALAPVSALLLAAAVLGEHIGVQQVLGMCAVLAAVLGHGYASRPGRAAVADGAQRRVPRQA